MIIKEQYGKVCPKNLYHPIGNPVCEECNAWRFKISDRVNEYGIKLADEWCDKLRVGDKP